MHHLHTGHCGSDRLLAAVYLVDVDLVTLNSLLGATLPATSALLGNRLLGWLCRLLLS